MKNVFFCIVLLMAFNKLHAAGEQQLRSPNGKVQIAVYLDKNISYLVMHGQDILINRSPISITLNDGTVLGQQIQVQKISRSEVNQTIAAKIYKKNKIADHYNELRINFKGNYSVLFRAYDDGIAYRFETTKKQVVVQEEQAEFNFPDDFKTLVPYVSRNYGQIETQFFNSFENTYVSANLKGWDPKRLAFCPVLIEGPNGKKMVITESDLINYPGMYLQNADGSTRLKGVFAARPKTIEQGGHNMLQGLVKSREPYIAKFDGAASFPWRTVIISEADKELLDNDMVYRLATPSEGDFSWVQPGKVAWDWWNDWNIYRVDFKSGINNETYKYYIDFAANHGIGYVILDEGWAVNKKADLYQVVPEIDLKELVAYAKTKHVDLILWAGYYALQRDIEGIFKHYAAMGIKGFKVDFMDRDDQEMVNFNYTIGKLAAKYHLMLDLHGTYKPTGLQRTFPNVINFEGVFGLEQMKWDNKADMVGYDVTMPFIRMVAGPMDYTQGAMRNATKGNFRAINNEAMSQGTRCRQLAEYVVFESPFNMLCDNPSNYINEKECTEFIAKVPTVWDETKTLQGEVGKYIALARRSDKDWYVGAMTNWDSRSIDIDLSFLGTGNFAAEVYRDGVNANRVARDYKKEIIDIPQDRKLKIAMAPGGGYAMRIYQK